MRLFSELVVPGDAVIEVGGHIGYITLHFANLVGDTGSVTVFEPAPGNLRYLRRNIAHKPSIRLSVEAVADYCGSGTLYIEDLTGQNNSLLTDYSLRDRNIEAAFVDTVQSSIEVKCTTIDAYLDKHTMDVPTLIKIDAEGTELAVLQGMRRTLDKHNPLLMVEVSEHTETVLALLRSYNYKIFTTEKEPLLSVQQQTISNLFCINENDPRLGSV